MLWAGDLKDINFVYTICLCVYVCVCICIYTLMREYRINVVNGAVWLQSPHPLAHLNQSFEGLACELADLAINNCVEDLK